MNIQLNEKQIEKINKLFELSPILAKEALETSLKKAANLVRKLEKEYIDKTYTADKEVLKNSNFKIKKKDSEFSFMASTKRNNLQNFNLSVKKPSASKEHLKGSVYKRSGSITMRTMFWGFYKKSSRVPHFENSSLYIRNDEDRNHISKVKTVSAFQMTTGLTPEMERKVIEIFHKELDKKLDEVM